MKKYSRILLIAGLTMFASAPVQAAGSKPSIDRTIVHKEVTMEHFDDEAHHFYAAGASTKLRQALDAFSGGKILIGIAGIPYKCPPAPLEVAFLIEAELRERGLRDKAELHFCSPIGRASPAS